MYNLLEYSDNYCIRSGNLWNYYIDEVKNDANENNPASNYRINDKNMTTIKFFKYKTKIIGSTTADGNISYA